MISIWLDSSWICLIYNSYIVKMTVRDKRQVFPLCHSNSDTCQKPTLTICILSLCSDKCKWKQLVITITSHRNHQSPFIFSIQTYSINTKNWLTMSKPFNKLRECPKNMLKFFFIRIWRNKNIGTKYFATLTISLS